MRIAAKWGLILGLAICIWTLALHALGFYTTRLGAGRVADIVATVLPLGAVALALRERSRTETLRFAQVMATALVVGLVSLVLTLPFFWWYHHVVNPEWSELLVAHLRETMTAAGRSATDVDKAIEGQRTSATDGAQLVGSIVGTVIFSVVIGLAASLVLKIRSRRSEA